MIFARFAFKRKEEIYMSQNAEVNKTDKQPELQTQLWTQYTMFLSMIPNHGVYYRLIFSTLFIINQLQVSRKILKYS